MLTLQLNPKPCHFRWELKLCWKVFDSLQAACRGLQWRKPLDTGLAQGSNLADCDLSKTVQKVVIHRPSIGSTIPKRDPLLRHQSTHLLEVSGTNAVLRSNKSSSKFCRCAQHRDPDAEWSWPIHIPWAAELLEFSKERTAATIAYHGNNMKARNNTGHHQLWKNHFVGCAAILLIHFVEGRSCLDSLCLCQDYVIKCAVDVLREILETAMACRPLQNTSQISCGNHKSAMTKCWVFM